MIDTIKTKSSMPPIWTTSSYVAPVPTVAPGGSTVVQELHATGRRTLWCVYRRVVLWKKQSKR